MAQCRRGEVQGLFGKLEIRVQSRSFRPLGQRMWLAYLLTTQHCSELHLQVSQMVSDLGYKLPLLGLTVELICGLIGQECTLHLGARMNVGCRS